MNWDKENKVPIFIINGFLEAGKTYFMRFTMEQEYFKTDGKTLLFLCEDGEEGYSQELLHKSNTVIINIKNIDEISPNIISELIVQHNPERILIEWNGMWMQDEFKIPETCFVNQVISVFDTSTLELYLKNMKPYMGPMLVNAELIICNRADNISQDALANYYIALRAMAPNAEIVFEGKTGEIRCDFSIALPYDIDADKLMISPLDFGIFYVDAMDRPDRYDGKHVEFTAQVLKPRGIERECFVSGRRAMTCCEADIQFLGFICKYNGSDRLNNKDWVKVRAKIRAENNRHYGGVGPILYADDVVYTGAIEELVRF